MRSAMKVLFSVFAFAFALALTFLIEEGGEFFGGHLPGSSLIFRPALFYPQVVTAGSREPLSLSVTLVTLRPGEEPDTLLLNVCPQRLFIARLLRALAIATPGAIVIDPRNID
jgi:hypothetical protein